MKHQAVVLNFDAKSVTYVRIDEVPKKIANKSKAKFVAASSTPPPPQRA